MKSGFVLIELIVATLIASILSGVLLTALSQSTRVQTSIDNTINISERIAIATNQLEKDLAGAFVPTQAEKTDNTQKTENVQSADTNKTSDQKNSSSDKDKETEQKTPQKKEQKPIEKIFYSINKNGILDTLTFVTNNPLVVFVGKDVGVVKSKVVRVQYTLKPDQENKDSYSLFRQESNELDLAEYKNVRPYEVISGIKKLTVTFTARTEKKQEKKESQQASSSAKATADTPTSMAKEKQKKEYEYKTQSEWISEQKQDTSKESEKKETEFPRIPYSIEFKITLWDKNKKEREFTFICTIPVDSIEAQLKDKKESVLPKQEQQKPDSNKSKQQGQQEQQNVMHVKQIQSQEVVVHNSIEALGNALDSLKKLLGHG